MTFLNFEIFESLLNGVFNYLRQIRNKQGKQLKKTADEDEEDLTFDVE